MIGEKPRKLGSFWPALYTECVGNLRTQSRVAVHYRVAVSHCGREARGTTENVSERGAMLSVDMTPSLCAGDAVQLGLTLPDGSSISASGRVRWVSSVLPGMVGVEFDLPMPVALVDHIEQMLTAQVSLATAG